MDYLTPGEILYSQDSIKNKFRSGHRNKYIGDTLDELMSGRVQLNDIPPIRVTQRPGSNKWVSLDNRRLWVIHHYAARRNCDTIRVNKVSYESLGYRDLSKFTADNGAGVSIKVRNGSPGGTWHYRISPITPRCQEPEVVKEETPANVSSQNSVTVNNKLSSVAVTPRDAASDKKEEGKKHYINKEIPGNISPQNIVSVNIEHIMTAAASRNAASDKKEGAQHDINKEIIVNVSENNVPDGCKFSSIAVINQDAAHGEKKEKEKVTKEEAVNELQKIMWLSWRRNILMGRLISNLNAVKNCATKGSRAIQRKIVEIPLFIKTMDSILKATVNKVQFRNMSQRNDNNEIAYDNTLFGKRKANANGLFRVRSEDEPVLKRMRPSWMSQAHNGYVDAYLKPPRFHYAYNITFHATRRTRVLRVQYIDGRPLYWFDVETGRLDYFENMKPDDWINFDEDEPSEDDIYVENGCTKSETSEIVDENVTDSDSKEMDYGDIEGDYDLDEKVERKEADYEDMPNVFDVTTVSDDSEREDEDECQTDSEYYSSDESEAEYKSTTDDESEVEEVLVYGLENAWSDDERDYL